MVKKSLFIEPAGIPSIVLGFGDIAMNENSQGVHHPVGRRGLKEHGQSRLVYDTSCPCLILKGHLCDASLFPKIFS